MNLFDFIAENCAEKPQRISCPICSERMTRRGMKAHQKGYYCRMMAEIAKMHESHRVIASGSDWFFREDISNVWQHVIDLLIKSSTNAYPGSSWRSAHTTMGYWAPFWLFHALTNMKLSEAAIRALTEDERAALTVEYRMIMNKNDGQIRL